MGLCGEPSVANTPCRPLWKNHAVLGTGLSQVLGTQTPATRKELTVRWGMDKRKKWLMWMEHLLCARSLQYLV